jgi:hypothetical protein
MDARRVQELGDALAEEAGASGDDDASHCTTDRRGRITDLGPPGGGGGC